MVAKTGGKGDLAGWVSDGDTHAAFVKELRVVLMPDAGHWFAKSLDIDYEASGATLEEVKKNFAEGLAWTINEHLVMFGNLDKVLVSAPAETLAEYNKLPPEKFKKQSLSLVTVLKQAFQKAHIESPEEKAKTVPFDGIRFIEPKEAVAA